MHIHVYVFMHTQRCTPTISLFTACGFMPIRRFLAKRTRSMLGTDPGSDIRICPPRSARPTLCGGSPEGARGATSPVLFPIILIAVLVVLVFATRVVLVAIAVATPAVSLADEAVRAVVVLVAPNTYTRLEKQGSQTTGQVVAWAGSAQRPIHIHMYMNLHALIHIQCIHICT